MARNPRIVFLPIPSAASSPSTVLTPHQPDQSPPTKRTHSSPSIRSQGLTFGYSGQSSPTSRLTLPADLDDEVKKVYGGRCAISGVTCSWGQYDIWSWPRMCPLVSKIVVRMVQLSQWINSPGKMELGQQLCELYVVGRVQLSLTR